MAISAALSVSNRLQRIVAAFLCLTAVQLVTVVTSCTPEPAPYAVRIPVQR